MDMIKNKDIIKQSIERLYTQNLGVKNGETVLLFTDRLKSGDCNRQRDTDMLALVEMVKEIAPQGVHVITGLFDATGRHGIEPPEVLWRAAYGDRVVGLLKERGYWEGLLAKSLKREDMALVEEIFIKECKSAVDVVIALSYYSTSHTSFRVFMTRLFKARYASMPLFDMEMFETSMTADWRCVAERTRGVAACFNSAVSAYVRAPNGTELDIGLMGVSVFEDNGILAAPGSFGNLPAGEVYLAPAKGTTCGVLVLEWGPSARLQADVRLCIEDGEVVKVSGEDPYAEELEGLFEKGRAYRNIAELGIGTNDMATRPDNILESEKILGTIHIALGDNSSFGGDVKVDFHQDYVFFNPTLTLVYPGGNKKTILDEGRLLNEY